jgi:hypothetical protein
MPVWLGSSVEKQVEKNFNLIILAARGLESGNSVYCQTVPAWFRRMINKKNKAKERHVLVRINRGEYELEVPHFKRDAAYDYW